jgi:GNAT superfamily N-acetyltransferase
MNNYKRQTKEYQQELQQASQPSPAIKRPRSKIKVEPFTADPEYFDPRKHDFTVKFHQDGHQVGMIAVTHKKNGIMPFQFHVHRDYRRQGIGTKLAQHAEKIARKQVIPSPDMTEDAVNWLKSYHKDRIEKSISLFAEDLVKSDDYKQKASTGIVLLHPVSISGKTHRDNGIPLHMTVKVFGSNTNMNPKDVEKHLENFTIPSSVDSNKMLFMPHILPGVGGTKHHVLLAYGAPPHVDHVRKGSEQYGPYLHNFLPHISVDQADWEKFSKMGPILTAEKIGLKVHPAELRSGPQIVKTY